MPNKSTSGRAECACCYHGHTTWCLDCLLERDCTNTAHQAYLSGLDRLSAAVFDIEAKRNRHLDAQEASALRSVALASAVTPPPVERRQGCPTCTEIGPLLVAPGTSGRTWQCSVCGTSWTPGDAPRPEIVRFGGAS